VNRGYVSEFEFDKILQLVAAHAQTCVGRRRLLDEAHSSPDVEAAAHFARVTLEMTTFHGERGRLSFNGIDDGLPWLEPGASSPNALPDLLDLLGLLKRVAAIRREIGTAPHELAQLHALAARLPDCAGLVDWAASRLGRDGRIPDHATPELARLRQRLIRVRQEVQKELESIRRSNPSVVSDAPPTLRRDRYCLPVHASGRSQLPGLVLDTSGSGATVYLEPYAAVELNNTLVEVVVREAQEVRRIIDEVAAALAVAREDLATGIDDLAALDAAQARALWGSRVDGRIVIPGDGTELVLRGASHPLLDARLRDLRAEVFGELERRRADHNAVPLDLRLPEGVNTLVISGPNAGGKTVVLKTVGVMVLLAYQGIPLPVDDGTSIPAFDHVWCHIGDEQDVSSDLSTFSGAMAATAALLREAGPRSLVLYDELGTGTDPLEGAALGCALLEELTRQRSVVLATTHLAAVALSANAVEGMDNASMEYDEQAARPTFRLRLGRPGRSRALEIAAAMGVSSDVLDHARELLGGSHLELDRWLRRLERVEGELLVERQELARQRLESEHRQRDLRGAEERLESELAGLPQKLNAERDRLRRRAQTQLDEALTTLDEATRHLKPLGRRRLQQLRHRALDLEDTPAPRLSARSETELEAGSTVRIGSLGNRGTVRELRGSQALVAVADKRLWVGIHDLEVTTPPEPGRPARVRLDLDREVAPELLLLGKDREQAREELEEYLDRALAAGRGTVRVVHGHGTGTLRAMVQEVCRHHPAVHSFRHPIQRFGGTGATEIALRGGADG